MMNIQKRLRAAMDLAGVSNTELAQHCGVSVQGVGKWLKQGTIKKEHLPVIAKLTDVSFQWLSTGEGIPPTEGMAHSYGFSVHESVGTYGTSNDITPDMIKELLPRVGTDTILFMTGILNDLRDNRLSEQDLNILKPLIQRFKDK